MNKNIPIGLPLFDYVQTGRIFAFPLNRRISKVRRVAFVLQNQKSDKAKDAYYRKIDEGLKANLLKSGVNPSKINAELDLFWNAVRVELDKLL